MTAGALASALGAFDLRATGDGALTGRNVPLDGAYRVYGGQILGQAIVAAASVLPSKTVRSIHTVFSKQASMDSPIRHEPRTISDGRTFAFVHIEHTQQALDGPVTVASSSVVLHQPEQSQLNHQQVTPLTSLDRTGTVTLDTFLPMTTCAHADADLDDRGVGTATFGVWLRAEGLSAPQEVQQALLAYASDWPLIGTNLRPIDGLAEQDSPETVQTAVVSHTLTFHADLDLSGWLLMESAGTLLRNARGHGTVHAFDETGRCVVSGSQDHLVRTRRA